MKRRKTPGKAARLGGRLALAELLGGAVHAKAADSPPAAPSADPATARLEAAMVHAPSADAAADAADQLERLRQGRIGPTPRLLLQRARREASENKFRDALSDLDDAIDMQGDLGVLWREHAAIQAAAGDKDAAIADLGRALAHDPTDILSWSLLSAIQESLNRLPLALEAWEHVLMLDPKIGDGARRLKRLHDRMVGSPT